jgi:hypothetical protein
LQHAAPGFQASFHTLGRLCIEVAARQQLPDCPGCNLQVKYFRINGTFSGRLSRLFQLTSIHKEANCRSDGYPEEVADHDEKRQGQDDEKTVHARLLPKEANPFAARFQQTPRSTARDSETENVSCKDGTQTAHGVTPAAEGIDLSAAGPAATLKRSSGGEFLFFPAAQSDAPHSSSG